MLVPKNHVETSFLVKKGNLFLDSGSGSGADGKNIFCHKTLSLNLPNVEFDFDVTVDIMQVLTDTSMLNLMLK